MSFVTTPIESRSPRVRQSAATRAVFPEPTGPPMPSRSGPPVRAACACGSLAWWMPMVSSWWLPDGRLRGEQSVGAAGMPLREQVEERIRVVGQAREAAGAGRGPSGRGRLPGDGVDVARELEGHDGDLDGVERQEALRGRRRAGH